MPSVTLTASALAAPSAGRASRAEVLDFVSDVLGWLSLSREAWAGVYVRNEAVDAFFADNASPLRQTLRRVFQESGIQEFDPNTVARAAEGLLELGGSFESRYGLRSALVDEASFTSCPDILKALDGHESLLDEARTSAALLIFLENRGECETDSLGLVVRPCADAHDCEVTVCVASVEHESGRVEDFDEEAPWRSTIHLSTCFSGWLETVDDTVLWRTATRGAEYIAAVKGRLAKTRRADSIPSSWVTLPEFALGPRFVERVKRSCPGQTAGFVNALLRAMAETIEHRQMADTHALRHGLGANDAQRVRASDGAKAWRRDIDREYHLHYWELGEGMVEFASVGPHNDFSIPE